MFRLSKRYLSTRLIINLQSIDDTLMYIVKYTITILIYYTYSPIFLTLYTFYTLRVIIVSFISYTEQKLSKTILIIQKHIYTDSQNVTKFKCNSHTILYLHKCYILCE